MSQICQMLGTAWHTGSTIDVLAVVTIGQGHVTLVCPWRRDFFPYEWLRIWGNDLYSLGLIFSLRCKGVAGFWLPQEDCGATTHHGSVRGHRRNYWARWSHSLLREKREKQPGLVCPSPPFPLLFLGFLLSNQGSEVHWALYSCSLPFL